MGLEMRVNSLAELYEAPLQQVELPKLLDKEVVRQTSWVVAKRNVESLLVRVYKKAPNDFATILGSALMNARDILNLNKDYYGVHAAYLASTISADELARLEDDLKAICEKSGHYRKHDEPLMHKVAKKAIYKAINEAPDTRARFKARAMEAVRNYNAVLESARANNPNIATKIADVSLEKEGVYEAYVQMVKMHQTDGEILHALNSRYGVAAIRKFPEIRRTHVRRPAQPSVEPKRTQEGPVNYEGDFFMKQNGTWIYWPGGKSRKQFYNTAPTNIIGELEDRLKARTQQ